MSTVKETFVKQKCLVVEKEKRKKPQEEEPQKEEPSEEKLLDEELQEEGEDRFFL